ncbi:PsbP-related protein [Herbivorax sp. ANBcel31]|uniref:PsbP-related protein n=1 Tax=Herbivorax sp. ANBcel31 TaxID=3069754 RepID=UPI0027B737CA|nr:PsbP-related protein [Herbivorax sp. ANBcel31]MDQ2087407.1 PsbP-related protein [Herbivorax sp. ANBcel31]
MKKICIVFFTLFIFLYFSSNLTYANLKYKGETFSITDTADFNLLDIKNTYDENSIALTDKKDQFTVLITSDVINDEALNNMRQILVDYTSSDQEIFYEIFEYKKSYFKAMVEHNKDDFYFGSSEDSLTESYIKVFKEYDQILFGESSNIILFNTIKNSKQPVFEETCLNITIPSFSNMSIYSINITGKKGFLTKDNINTISSIIKSLNIPNSDNCNNTLDLFSDAQAVDRANQGIYPDLNQTNIEFTEYSNKKHNYKIYHPSTFIPYLKNSMVKSFDYVSFKIDYNKHYSISVENQVDSDTYAMDKKEQLKSLNGNKLTVLDYGESNISNEYYNFLRYKTKEDYGMLYVTEFYTLQDSKLFTISLNSKFKEPSSTVINIFEKIVSSIEFTESDNIYSLSEDVTFDKFTNDSEGYSFLYPDSWTVTNKSKNINFNTFHVKSSEYSASLDIIVNESSFLPVLSKADILEFVTQTNNSSLKQFFINYSAPYADKTHKILNTSFKEKNDVLYIYKLINYLDERDRHRLAYSIDIVHNNKIYSLFISINDFLASGTDFTDDRLMNIIDIIADSFCIEKNALPKEHLNRALYANALIANIGNLNAKNNILLHPTTFVFVQTPTMVPVISRWGFPTLK